MGTPGQLPTGAWRTRTVVGLIIGATGLVVLLGVLFARSDALTKAVSGIGLLGALVFGIFAQVKYPRVSARHGDTIAVVLLIFDVLLGGTMAGVGYHNAHKPIDVTAEVMLTGNLAVLPGHTASVDLPVTARRPRLDIVFRVSDHNTQTGLCAPQTALSVTPVRNGNRAQPIAADSDAHVLVPLLVDVHQLHLEVEVRNLRHDNGCAVDIDVTSARLTSG